MTPSAGLREPLGGGRAPSAGPNAAPRRGPQGWAGYTQDGWPQATDQTPSAKRLTIATVPQQPQGSQLAARRARMRPASADGCATVPSEGTLHRVGFVNPTGREAVGGTKRSFSAATGGHFTKQHPYVNPKGHAVGPPAGSHHNCHAHHATASWCLGMVVLRCAH